MRTIYLECNMGAAGDMLSAAFFELLAEEKKKEFLQTMNGLLPDAVVTCEPAVKCGIKGSHMRVVVHGQEEASVDVKDHEHMHEGHEHMHEGHEHFHEEHDHEHMHGDHDHECCGHMHEDGHEHFHEDHDHEHMHMHGDHEHECCGHMHEDDHEHFHEDHDHEHMHMHGDHDHECCGHMHEDDHEHFHEDYDHEHMHEDHEHMHGDHEHEHAGRVHHHEHHSPSHIAAQIDGFALPDEVKEKAKEVYALLAEAEAQAHGMPVTEIHFHEVGSADAVLDITGVCLLLHMLSPEKILASPVNAGSGNVRCAHGILPVPAPATAALLKEIPWYMSEVPGELCTPTGAALLKVFAADFGPMPAMRVSQIGYGMGNKDFPRANCVRAFLGETEREAPGLSDQQAEKNGILQEAEISGMAGAEACTASAAQPVELSGIAGEEGCTASAAQPVELSGIAGAEACAVSAAQPVAFPASKDGTGEKQITELCANVDDMTSEQLGYAMDQLFKEGAREVFFTPIYMKKNRPGTLLTCICRTGDADRLTQSIFRLTSTFGVRRKLYDRFTLNVSFEEKDTPWGPVRMKTGEGYGVKKTKPEYEDLIRAMEASGKTWEEILSFLK